jgi:hypothetical protein
VAQGLTDEALREHEHRRKRNNAADRGAAAPHIRDAAEPAEPQGD